MKRATDRDFAAVRLLITDVDGVLTDAGMYYDGDGPALMRFSIVDGLGMVLLSRAGVDIAILTSGDYGPLMARAKRLAVKHLRTGIMDKGKYLPDFLKEIGVGTKHVAYMGDDINDHSAMRQVALPIAVRDAQPEILAIAHHVTVASGGRGAVREVANRILLAKGLDPVKLWDDGEEGK